MDRGHWSRKLLEALKCPETRHNRNALVSWITAEGCMAAWNPLATTRSLPGDSLWNSTGVRNYADFSDGLRATVLTLNESGHNYEPILKALHQNRPAMETLDAVAKSAWGTGELAKTILPQVKSDYEKWASKEIGQ